MALNILKHTHTHLLHQHWGSMTNSERPKEAVKAKGHASSMKKDTSSSRTGNTVTDMSPICGDREVWAVTLLSFLRTISAATLQFNMMCIPIRWGGERSVCMSYGAEGRRGTFHRGLQEGTKSCLSTWTVTHMSHDAGYRNIWCSRATIKNIKKKYRWEFSSHRKCLGEYTWGCFKSENRIYMESRSLQVHSCDLNNAYHCCR